MNKGGNPARSITWQCSQGPGSAGSRDGRSSEINKQSPGPKVLDGGNVGVADGVVTSALSNGEVSSVRAVPGAEIYHLEKKVNTESFFVRLVRSAVVFDLSLDHSSLI